MIRSHSARFLGV